MQTNRPQEPKSLYCQTCQQHTPHKNFVEAYATICQKCGSHTSQLIRLQAEQYHFTAPDGTTATVVENTPEKVTYYIPSGPYKAYYYYDKRTKAKAIKHG